MIGVFVQLNDDSRYAKSRPIGYVICENGCWDELCRHQRQANALSEGSPAVSGQPATGAVAEWASVVSDVS